MDTAKLRVIAASALLGPDEDLIREAADTIERLQKERDAWEEVAKERGESFVRSIEDFNNMRDQKDAALAEVERLKAQEHLANQALNEWAKR